ncbi:MAG: clindamycin resistance transfer factor BtgA [Tannerella sp.]|jgi:Mg2+ and Co2+ transporter CorA|nr:clindamycin resistance transfer factor BtgA [Tannerella sp.]
MERNKNKTALTTIGIDHSTNRQIDKLCKRYNLKKGEIVKLAFGYLDKACINPSEPPESTKAELGKINKRQDDLIRFIRHFEEEQLNPMIRVTHSIATKFDMVVKTLTEQLDLEVQNSKEILIQVLRKLDEHFARQAEVINNQARVIDECSKSIKTLSQVQEQNSKKFLKVIALYAELAACGVMDGKRKENLKAEIINLINEK